MNGMETELTNALDAAAETLRADMLRPLTQPEGRRHWKKRPHPWLAPVAAASAVALIIGLAVTITGHVHSPPSSVPATVSTPPRYYAQIASDGDLQVVVRSTVTGAVTDRLVNPAAASSAQQRIPAPVAVAAAPDDRTFYVEYYVGSQTMIYTFGITDRGTVTAMTLVKGGVLNGEVYVHGGPKLAVSPDGTSLALNVDTTYSAKNPAVADEIVVLNLRTGMRRVWQGGLYKPGSLFSIQSLSWAGTGTLDFLPAWCTPSDSACAANDNIDWDAQVRSLNVASDDGSLAGSTVLLRESATYPDIVNMVADQQGSLSVVVLSGPDDSYHEPTTVTVDEVQASSGALQRVLYHHGFASEGIATENSYKIGADPSGRYLTLSISLGLPYLDGWFDQGVLRPVPGAGDGIAWLGITQAVLRIRVLLWA
jgi:hypothetical protein